MSSMQGIDGQLTAYAHRVQRSRVLIFNCTNGRSGNSFLGCMLSNAGELLKKYSRDQEAGTLFDQVVFCANVTYADGGFKGGTLGSLFRMEKITKFRQT